jgi:hypothetical protein
MRVDFTVQSFWFQLPMTPDFCTFYSQGMQKCSSFVGWGTEGVHTTLEINKMFRRVESIFLALCLGLAGTTHVHNTRADS